jgi:hypothetical protein
MRIHTADVRVLENACRALWHLAADSPSSEEQLAAIEATTIAMRAHHAHAGVQEFACGALGSVAFDRDGTVAADRRRRPLQRFRS